MFSSTNDFLFAQIFRSVAFYLFNIMTINNLKMYHVPTFFPLISCFFLGPFVLGFLCFLVLCLLLLRFIQILTLNIQFRFSRFWFVRQFFKACSTTTNYLNNSHQWKRVFGIEKFGQPKFGFGVGSHQVEYLPFWSMIIKTKPTSTPHLQRSSHSRYI